MLSLWKLRVGAEEYYLSQVANGIDDYYSGAGEIRGCWLGTAASALGLDGDVAGDDLRAVLAGLAPGTGLTPNGTQVRAWRNRVPGFDLTFSAPKSVSVLYALADPLVRAEVTEAIDTSVREAISWLEREACFVRRGSNNREARTAPFEQWGARRLPGAGFVAAGFRHRISRAGDPQLHTHVLVANTTRGPDGRWTALDAQGIYRSKLTAGALFQSTLRHELSRRLGLEWRRVHNDVADLAGIPSRVVSLFSKRRHEIEEEMARLGVSGPAAAAEATLATRSSKADVDAATLDERWRSEATTVGFGPHDIDALLAHARLAVDARQLHAESLVAVHTVDRDTGEVIERLVDLARFVDLIAHELPETDATVTRHDVQRAVGAHLAGAASAEVVERLTDRVLASDELVPLPAEPATSGWEERWTTRSLLALEADLRAMFTPTGPSDVGRVEAALIEAVIGAGGHDLGADQQRVVRQVCTQGLAVEVVVGRAGTGKTHTMNVVRQVFTAAGFRTVGVAPSARAARELGDDSGIESCTMHRFLADPSLDARTVLVVDEAGMAGTRLLHQVLTHAQQAGAKVVLVGDHHQLPEINAGGGFAAAIDAVGERRAELVHNRRQQQDWERIALAHLRHGDVHRAWVLYVDHGRVILDHDHGRVHARAVHDWWHAHSAGRNAHLIAGTRAEADLLNRLARRHLAAAGHLHGPALTIHDKPFQVGDRIVLLENASNQLDLDTGLDCRVDNGMIATITRCDHANRQLDLELRNGRHIRLRTDYVDRGRIDHGYATTIHKAQGMTCDDVFVVGPAGLYREAGYVALSRARNTAHLYATTRDAATIGERDHTTGIRLPTEHHEPGDETVAALALSRSKRFASDQAVDLTDVADLAANHTLGHLTARRRQIRDITRQLGRSDVPDPAVAADALDRARTHRVRMHEGGRVNALDWDNVGTIISIDDSAGTAIVHFTTSDGAHHATKTLAWESIRPIDHPEPADLPDAARDHLTRRQAEVNQIHARWRAALAAHGIDDGDAQRLDAAIAHRSRQRLHALRATPPAWLQWWLGPRPTDPAGAAVYDDELEHLASWRDTHQLDDEEPGYGPPPTDPSLHQDWSDRMDHALHTHLWLREHRPRLDPQPATVITPSDTHHRLAELDELFATAPPDQRHLIDAITNDQTLSATDRADLLAAATRTQSERRNWILEHWPHIVEHQELTTLAANHDPLAHWPTPLGQEAQALLERLMAATVDTPEPRTLDELDDLVDAHNPNHRIRRLQRDLHVLHQQARALDQAPHDTEAQPLVGHHLARLRMRIDQLTDDIDAARTDATLNGWGSSTTPELATAIASRANHLAHTALHNSDTWILEAIRRLTADRDDIDTPEAWRHLTIEAASRERHGVGRVPAPTPAHRIEVSRSVGL